MNWRPPYPSPPRPPAISAKDKTLLLSLRDAIDRAERAKQQAALDDAFRSVRFFAKLLPSGDQTDGEALADYRSGQWWVQELHKLREGGPVTDDTKRALAVVQRLAKLLNSAL